MLKNVIWNNEQSEVATTNLHGADVTRRGDGTSTVPAADSTCRGDGSITDGAPQLTRGDGVECRNNN